jgi:hypothetical protein
MEGIMSEAMPALVEFAAYVGGVEGWENYSRAWTPALLGQGKIREFNFRACFLSVLWLGYRKMYRYALVCYGVILAFNLIEGILYFGPQRYLTISNCINFNGVIGITIAVIVGIKGNQWYFSSAKREINRIHAMNLSQENCLKMIAQKGGTSIWKTIGLFLLYLFIATILIFILVFIIQSEKFFVAMIQSIFESSKYH